ncbi:MAG: ATP-binding cassette domain-containing protein [bacterium]
MSISVRNIVKLYGTQKALDSVSVEIKPGEVVGLLGPNGAGKSTLMKILTCFIPPTSGEASVCGFDILEQSIEIRKKVGYLPENNPLYLDLYVREFLRFIAGINHTKIRNQKSEIRTGAKRSSVEPNSKLEIGKSKIENRISEIIALTGLEAEQHKKIGALSRGYRQRVGLAQVLIHDPEVLILDEPTSGLDPNQLLDIRTLIQSIGKEKTVIMSTHIMQEVEAICNRAIIIHKGKIIADDTTRNLQHLSSSRNVIRVEFNSPVGEALLKKIAGVARVVKQGATANHWQLESEAGEDIREEVFNFAVGQGLTVLSMQREEQKLEEVFQELTKN